MAVLTIQPLTADDLKIPTDGPWTTPQGGPPVDLNPKPVPQSSGSPIHDYIRSNPSATPEQVQSQFPAMSLAGIKTIMGQTPQSAPPNPIAQAMAPLSAPNAQGGPSLNAFTSPEYPGYVPQPPMQSFPQGVSNTPAPSQGVPTGTSQGAPPDAAATRAATLAGMPGYVPSEMSAPGASGTNPSLMDNPPQGGPSHGNNFLRGLERFAPALAVALASRNNPGAGAALIGGWNQGVAQQKTEQMQRDALARQAAQQKFENDLKSRDTQDTIDYHKGVLANDAATLQSKKDLQEAKDRSAKSISDAIKGAVDGGSARAIVEKIDPSDSSGFIAALSNPDGSSKEKNPWYDKATQAAGNDIRAKHYENQDEVAAKRADSYAQQVQANKDKITAETGLIKTRTGYYDAKTKRVVPDSLALDRQRNAMAHFLGVQANEKPLLDKALMQYQSDLGDAATYNAESKGEEADARVAEIDARTDAISAKDPLFAQTVQLLKQARQIKEAAQANDKMDDDEKKRIVKAQDIDIEKYAAIVNKRLDQGGGMASPAKNRQTPRSQAWRSRQLRPNNSPFNLPPLSNPNGQVQPAPVQFAPQGAPGGINFAPPQTRADYMALSPAQRAAWNQYTRGK